VQFVVQRLWHSAVVLLAVALLVFVLMRLTGDPIAVMLPAEATAEDAELMRRELGLDRPLYEQFVIFVANSLTGNFGQSYRHHQPALGLVLERLPATLWLTFAAMAISLAIAVPAGIVAALGRGSIFDSVSRVIALVGQAMPTFWLGLMLILLFSVRLKWLPPAGNGGPEYVILPAITLGAYSAALTMRLLRSSLLEVLGRDYIRTGRAKGLSERTIIVRHALKNAAIPVVTVIGLQVGRLLAGSVVTETVFGYGGMGLLAVQAILGRDLTIVQAFVIVSAVIILTINFLVDLLYAAIDPRIRYGRQAA
jgi:ABC-type dipeptide/oligopeptide/nickel transport system permease component